MRIMVVNGGLFLCGDDDDGYGCLMGLMMSNGWRYKYICINYIYINSQTEHERTECSNCICGAAHYYNDICALFLFYFLCMLRFTSERSAITP